MGSLRAGEPLCVSLPCPGGGREVRVCYRLAYTFTSSAVRLVDSHGGEHSCCHVPRLDADGTGGGGVGKGKGKGRGRAKQPAKQTERLQLFVSKQVIGDLSIMPIALGSYHGEIAMERLQMEMAPEYD